MNRLAAFFAVSIIALPAVAAVPAPRVGPLTSVPRAPYDETAANDQARVAAAAARAKAAHKLLLVDFGGNWCPDCLMLAGVMDHPDARAFVKKNFEVVLVDVGRFDKNLNIPARYGLKKLDAVPTVLVVSPDGKVLNRNDVFALGEAASMQPQAVINKLASWVK